MAKVKVSCIDEVKVALAPVLQVPEPEGVKFLCVLFALANEEHPFNDLIRALQNGINSLPLSVQERRNLVSRIKITSSLGEIIS